MPKSLIGRKQGIDGRYYVARIQRLQIHDLKICASVVPNEIRPIIWIFKQCGHAVPKLSAQDPPQCLYIARLEGGEVAEKDGFRLIPRRLGRDGATSLQTHAKT